MNIENIRYIKFTPGGNDTALVIDENYSKVEKKIINDYILGFDKSIEQVGFLKKDEYRLDMAGGEFCGNATRSAAMYYLNGKIGNIKITVNGEYKLNAGIDEDYNCYSEIPISNNKDLIKQIDKNTYLIKLDGITFLILNEEVSRKIIEKNINLKEYSMELIKKYKLNKYKASGVIYLEGNDDISIKPIVYVKEINTLFYETACGSGTASVGILKSYLNKTSQELDIKQPSGKIIKVKTEYDDNVKKVEITGVVESTLKLKKIKK